MSDDIEANVAADVPLAERTTAPMLFCSTCSNLLYPECDQMGIMLWRCNSCNATERHDDTKMVHVLNLQLKSGQVGDMDLLAEFASDPTALRDASKRCPKCDHANVACFVNPLGQSQEDMTLYFACPNPRCRHVWKSLDVGEA